MKLRLLVVWCLFVGAVAPAALLELRTLTVGGTTYSNVSVLGFNTTDVFFTHAKGISNAKLKYLEPELQKTFRYDPQAATAAEQRQREDEARYKVAVAANLAAQAAAAKAAPKPPRTYEQSLEDPISDRSLLGKPGPALIVEKWLGEPPATQDKPMLVLFWAPWSVPCRKAVTGFNALHKQLGEKVAVIGITADSETDVQELAPKIEFASALDSKATMSQAAGVTCIPCALLMDAQRVVRYLGHPAALTEKSLQALLARPAE